MRKKLLPLAAALLMTVCAHAQLSLTLQVPPTGVLLKPQLWNMVIVNSGTSDKMVIINMTLSDAATGQPVMTGTGNIITLTPGANQVTSQTVAPIQYDYLSPDITDQNPDGYLPAGNYIVCFAIDDPGGRGPATIVEECSPVTVEPLSPPVLNTPADDEVIETSLPQFTWIPPTPLQIFSNLNYDFILVEVGQNQNKAEAIQNNVPVYTTNTTDPFLNYPASGNSLDTGKLYAWQVVAKNNNQYAAQSDVWGFRISSQALTGRPAISPYAALKRNLDAGMATTLDNFKAYYENDAEDTAAVYHIFLLNIRGDTTSEENLYREVKSGTIKLVKGYNLIEIPFFNSNQLESGNIYLFQFINGRNEKWNLKVIYYKREIN